MKKHIITIATVKGGVGKSTTAAALAEAAARDGRRTLAIDSDGQGSLSICYKMTGAKQTVYNAFSEGNLADAIQPTAGGFDIIPGSGNLAAVEYKKDVTNTTLEEALEPIKKKYDFIIIDAPPVMGRLMNNTIFAANEIICPLEAEFHSLRGFLTMIDIVNQAKQSKRNLRIIGALIVRYDNRPIINRDLKDMTQEEAAAAKIPYLGEIRKCIKIVEAQALGKPLYQYAPSCTAMKDYSRIYEEITK